MTRPWPLRFLGAISPESSPVGTMPIVCSSRTLGVTETQLCGICCRVEKGSGRQQCNPVVPLPHHCDKRAGDSRVELNAGPAFDVRQGALRLPGLAIGPLGSECVVDVTDV